MGTRNSLIATSVKVCCQRSDNVNSCNVWWLVAGVYGTFKEKGCPYSVSNRGQDNSAERNPTARTSITYGMCLLVRRTLNLDCLENEL